LRDGPQQHRYASDAAGVYAFSRIDRRRQRPEIWLVQDDPVVHFSQPATG